MWPAHLNWGCPICGVDRLPRLGSTSNSTRIEEFKAFICNPNSSELSSPGWEQQSMHWIGSGRRVCWVITARRGACSAPSQSGECISVFDVGRRHGSGEQWANLIGTKSAGARWDDIKLRLIFSISLSLFCPALILSPSTFLSSPGCYAHSKHLSFSAAWTTCSWMLTVLVDVALVRKTSTRCWPIESLLIPGYSMRDPPHSFGSAKYLAWNRENRRGAVCVRARPLSLRPQLWGFSSTYWDAPTKKNSEKSTPRLNIFVGLSLCVRLTRSPHLLWKRQFFPRVSGLVPKHAPCLRHAPQYVCESPRETQNMLHVVCYTEK